MFGATSACDAYQCFQTLLFCGDVKDFGSHTLNLVHALHLGKLEKGVVNSEAKFKSRNERWFTVKNKEEASDVDDKTMADTNLYIHRDSLSCY